MRILVSNDDGYLAEGILKLNEALGSLARTTIMAPDRNRSGASNSLTLDVPLRVFQSAPNVHYVAGGTPTDCVHIAISGYFDFEFDLVCSGINDGANLGDDTLYSGTVAAERKSNAVATNSSREMVRTGLDQFGNGFVLSRHAHDVARKTLRDAARYASSIAPMTMDGSMPLSFATTSIICCSSVAIAFKTPRPTARGESPPAAPDASAGLRQ